MPDENSAFNKALSNFTFGVASKDLICHMAAEGYSVRQIKATADYPVPEKKIAETVWEYYIETGIILLTDGASDPAGKPVIQSDGYEYVMDIGRFGKRSFRQVKVPKPDIDIEKYVPLDIGIYKAREPGLYEKLLAALDSRQRDYISGLPWPDERVYHIRSLRINEILERWRDVL